MTTWTAPQMPRANAPLVAGERESLDGWLDYHRSTLLTKCQGLTGEQLARRAVPPSTLSPARAGPASGRRGTLLVPAALRG